MFGGRSFAEGWRKIKRHFGASRRTSIFLIFLLSGESYAEYASYDIYRSTETLYSIYMRFIPIQLEDKRSIKSRARPSALMNASASVTVRSGTLRRYHQCNTINLMEINFDEKKITREIQWSYLWDIAVASYPGRAKIISQILGHRENEVASRDTTRLGTTLRFIHSLHSSFEFLLVCPTHRCENLQRKLNSKEKFTTN